MNHDKKQKNIFHNSLFIIHNSSLFPAIFFLTATTAGHLGIGIIAFISVGVISLSNLGHLSHLSDLINPVKKLFFLFGGVFLLLGYWILPILTGGNYHNISFWDPVWKFDSYGAIPTLTRLFNGELFDFGRKFPILTILTLFGLFGAVSGKIFEDRFPSLAEQRNGESKTIASSGSRKFYYEQQRHYFPFVLLFLFWLLLYFGRTTWGPLIDLIPGMVDFHLSRFIVGLHMAGLFLIPMGIEKIGEWVTRYELRVKHIRLFAYSFICLFAYFSVFPQTLRYAAHNDVLIKQANENYDKQEKDASLLLLTLNNLLITHPGRVYAGRGGTWGKDLRIAETPYYMYLSTYGIPTVLWLPQTWSPNSDIEQYFSEDQAKDYVLYNIRYVVAPPDQPAQPFWEKIKETNSWKLYEVNRQNQPDGSPTIQQYNNTTIPQMGYITTGVKPAIVSVTKENFVNVVRLWIQSDYHKQGLYPELTFDKEYPKTTGLPNFKMLDEVTYQVPARNASASVAGGPDGSTHNLFSEVPKYISPLSNVSTLSNLKVISQSSEADMVFKATVEVPETCTECLVILKQTFHPSWQATVDGKPAKTLTVFPFYTAIKLDSAGTHEVVFSYNVSGVKIFLLNLSIVTIIVFSFATIRNLLKKS